MWGFGKEKLKIHRIFHQFGGKFWESKGADHHQSTEKHPVFLVQEGLFPSAQKDKVFLVSQKSWISVDLTGGGRFLFENKPKLF